MSSWKWLCAFVCCLYTAVWAQEVPEYNCLKTSTAPIIDGLATDAVWQTAAPIQLYDVEDLSATQVHSRPTEVRMLWDDEQLYFLFVVTDADVWSTYQNRDDQIWQEEVVEIFIDPDGDALNYAEIEVNPLNVVFDLILSRPWGRGGRGFAQWNPVFESAVHVDGTLNDPADSDRGWSVEIALPWAALATDIADVMNGFSLPPQSGDTWRMNLYRFERVREDGAVVDDQASAWGTVGVNDFHVPERFGRLTFSNPATAVEAGSWSQVKQRKVD